MEPRFLQGEHCRRWLKWVEAEAEPAGKVESSEEHGPEWDWSSRKGWTQNIGYESASLGWTWNMTVA